MVMRVTTPIFTPAPAAQAVVQKSEPAHNDEAHDEWSGWNKWLSSHLDTFNEELIEALGTVINDERWREREEVQAALAPLRQEIADLHQQLANLPPALAAKRSSAAVQKSDQARDWSGWDKWLRAHLDIERDELIEDFGETLSVVRQELRDQISALELKLAELTGAIDILRGLQPPPPAKFPTISTWQPDTIYHEGAIVAFAGGTYQAQRDTARVPAAQDWVCLAKPGNSLTVRGTYSNDAEYRCLDVTMINGSSFVALKDNPGSCPGSDWQLLASRGSRGDRGRKGERGLTGPRGERGAAAPSIQSWEVDRASYAATPILSDGTKGPPLELRALFEQFVSERGE